MAFTYALLLFETGLTLLFPLFIGFAIDDALAGTWMGVMKLGLLGVGVMMIGTIRRVFDTRFYARIYESLGSDVISTMKNDDTSVKAARLGMVRELVEFLENSLPELIFNVVGLIGVVAIIASLNLTIFYLSILVSLLIFVLYWFTSGRTLSFNTSLNDELEKQVDVLKENSPPSLLHHLKEMMRWNIRLSDLEAGNFALSWLVLMGFLVGSIIIAVGDGIVAYGALFALVMYVFQYMENVVSMPFIYQEWLRLTEIKNRIEVSLAAE